MVTTKTKEDLQAMTVEERNKYLIDNITPEQEEIIEQYKQEALALQLYNDDTFDEVEINRLMEQAYSYLDKPKPRVIIADSPRHAMEIISKDLKGLDKVEYQSTSLLGCQDLYWISFYKFCVDVLGVEIEQDLLDKLELNWNIAQQIEWWWPYDDVVVVSKKATEIHWNDDKVLHKEDGPCIKYLDGYSVYAWRGIRVPKDWIEDKASLSPQLALTWENVEQRRAACEILGWENILEQLNSVTIDKDDDPMVGELVEVDIPEIGREKFLRVLCGTGRKFALPVPPETKTALEANAWTWNLAPEDYMPEVGT